MRLWPRFVMVSIWVVVGPIGTVSAGVRLPPAASVPDVVTMHLGISPGETNQHLPLGSGRRALERALPELFLTASDLGVRIESVSVGQGFWSEGGGASPERRHPHPSSCALNGPCPVDGYAQPGGVTRGAPRS